MTLWVWLLIALGIASVVAGVVMVTLWQTNVLFSHGGGKPTTTTPVGDPVATTPAPDPTPTPTPATQTTRTLVRLSPTNIIGLPEAGWSLSSSHSGNRIAVGGPYNNSVGSVWVFDRTSPSDPWSTVNELSNNTSSPCMGQAVSLSADGNYLAVAYGINPGCMVRVWTWSNESWIPYSDDISLLVSDPQSLFVPYIKLALSGNGDTLVVTHYGDTNSNGAYWVFGISAGSHTEQISKTQFGWYCGVGVALSFDGNVMALADQSYTPAHIFRRTNGVWSADTALTPTGIDNEDDHQQTFPHAEPGISLSADGNVCAVALRNHLGLHVEVPNGTGTAVVFRFDGTNWQQDPELVRHPTAVGQGTSVALSGDGNTLVLGAKNWRAIPGETAITGGAFAFRWDGTTWVREPLDLVGGDISNLNRGWSLCANMDGSVVVVGSVNGYAGTPASTGAAFAWVAE